MGRSPCCDKAAVKRGSWSEEEDACLRSYISQHGVGAGAGGWMALPRKAGLQRCGKSCRLRWLNYLRPGVRHGAFSPEEDRVVRALHAAVGSRWSLIAAYLPGRTDNAVKNYWNTRLRKKKKMLLFAGGDPHDIGRRHVYNNNVDAVPPLLEPWTAGLPYTGCGGAGGSTDDDMMMNASTKANVVIQSQPVDASYANEQPAATTELDEIFRSLGATANGGKLSDHQSQSSTEIDTSWYYNCQHAAESVLQQHLAAGMRMPYL